MQLTISAQISDPSRNSQLLPSTILSRTLPLMLAVEQLSKHYSPQISVLENEALHNFLKFAYSLFTQGKSTEQVLEVMMPS